MRACWVVLVLLAGCSFGIVRGPGSTETACTTSRAAPIADTVVTAAMAAVAVTAYIRDSRCEASGGPDAEHWCFNFLYGVPAGVTGLVYAISSMYGFTTVGSCRHYKRDHPADHA